MLNVDITQKGQIITRFGYELFASISGATGTMRGLLPFYRTYGTDSGDYLLLFHSNGNAYYVTNNQTTPQSISSYGTDSGKVRGTVFNNLAIYGNGLAANTIQTWSGTGASSNLGGSPPDAKYFSTFQKRLVLSGVSGAPSRVDYSDTDNQGAGWGASNQINVNVGDGQDCTSLIAHNDFLQVFKEDSIYGINFSFDSSYALTIPQLQPIVTRTGGAIAPDSVQPVYGYSYFLSDKGFQGYGVAPSGVDRREPIALSWKINPTVNKINKQYMDSVTSTFFNEKYLCTVPFANSSTNDYTFVYNEIYKSWSLYNNIPAYQYAIFRDSQKNKQLYFASTQEAKVFRFNSSFSDDGVGYTRSWRSKTFTLGERTYWRWLDVEGSIAQGTTLNVYITVDGITRSFTIDRDNFVSTATGEGQIGDNYIGDAYIGSAVGSDTATPLYRFKKRIHFPDTISNGYEMYFEFSNQAVGEGWKISRVGIAYEGQPIDPSYNRVYT